MNYKNYTEDTEKNRLKVIKALNFINDHPAFIGTDIFNFDNCFWWHLVAVDKNGISETDKITVYRHSKHYNKYKHLFPKKSNSPEYVFDKIDVPYKEVYGQDWKFDHCEYWFEISLKVYTGNDLIKTNNWHPKEKDYFNYTKYENWQSYAGSDGGANTFEEMILKLAKIIKRDYGNFDSHDFDTTEEILNHKQIDPFIFHKKDEKGCSKMEFNKNYINISPATYNRRWLEWYVKTDHCKKNWKDEFDKYLK
jgi:hypothetical protein